MRRPRPSILVTDLGRARRGEIVELSAGIWGLPRGDMRRAWIRLPAAIADPDSGELDGAPWLVALLPAAAALGRPIEVEGAVSERLLSGCSKAMRIWAEWYPTVRPVPIRVRSARADERRGEGVACFFSGGVDSSYSVLKSLEEPRQPTVPHLLLCHGFDVVGAGPERRALVSERVGRTAGVLGLSLVELDTNLRSITDPFADWGRLQHGPLLGALGLAAGARFGRVVVAATNSYDALHPWGSHPLLDPLWSTEAVEIVHDGCEATRVEKVLWRIAGSQAVLENLRVCYLAGEADANCGRCEKCLRTMVGLAAAGALERAGSFEGPLDPERVAAIRPRDYWAKPHARHNLEALERLGVEPELQRALRRLLRRPAAPRAAPLEARRTLHMAATGLRGRLGR